MKTAVEIIEYCRLGDDVLPSLFILALEELNRDEIQAFCKEILELQHFKDTMIGAWATDRPDMVPKELLETVFWEVK